MEGNESKKDIVQVYYIGEFYLEWTEVCDVIGLPRTTLLRMIKNLDILKEEDVFYYKNRKLIKRNWVFEFWKMVSQKTLSNK
jgi:hypothetical protein